MNHPKWTTSYKKSIFTKIDNKKTFFLSMTRHICHLSEGVTHMLGGSSNIWNLLLVLEAVNQLSPHGACTKALSKGLCQIFSMKGDPFLAMTPGPTWGLRILFCSLTALLCRVGKGLNRPANEANRDIEFEAKSIFFRHLEIGKIPEVSCASNLWHTLNF